MNEKAARAYRAFLEAYGLDLQALGMEKEPSRFGAKFSSRTTTDF